MSMSHRARHAEEISHRVGTMDTASDVKETPRSAASHKMMLTKTRSVVRTRAVTARRSAAESRSGHMPAEVGAAKLEMLFVDEGFGSLDADTLSVVIEQLEKLQDTGRVVGVISHVAEMKSAITDKIEVVSNGDGTSRIEWPGA